MPDFVIADKMKFGICTFDRARGVVRSDLDLGWFEGTLTQAKEMAEKGPSKCALFWPADVQGLGCPRDPFVDLNTFQSDPAKWGVCYYKASTGFFVFE